MFGRYSDHVRRLIVMPLWSSEKARRILDSHGNIMWRRPIGGGGSSGLPHLRMSKGNRHGRLPTVAFDQRSDSRVVEKRLHSVIEPVCTNIVESLSTGTG